MKPSEKRALEAEKRAEREALAREKELEANASSSSAATTEIGGIDPRATYKKLPEEEIEVKGDGYHRESFFGKNVRLITFIVCMALILTVLGPWGIDMLVAHSRAEIFGEEVDNKRDLTTDAVVLLADMGTDMTWKSLENFNYNDFSFTKEGRTTYVREYEIVGTPLFLRVGGTSLNGSPDYVRLIDYNSGEFISDIRKESVRAFISEHSEN
jgi:hypothetical protein